MDVKLPRVALLAFCCAVAFEMSTAVPGAAQSGLPSRPPNPSCIAPPRLLTGTAAQVVFQNQFSVGEDPTAFHRSPTNPAVYYVGLKEGRILRAVWNGSGSPTVTTMLDIASRVVTGPEAGFSGMVFHPDFSTNGFVYVHYSGANQGPAPGPFTEYVSRFTSLDGGLTLDPSSEMVLLVLPQYGIFHHGGKMQFGPDGFLYVGFGDGDNPPESQDLFEWYGKILRIDVDGGTPYAIPAGNPFAGGGGAPELYAWGLRNPYQFSFDALTGDLWVGDVGFQTWEEIDRVEIGLNYGWPIMEGNHCLVEPCNSSGLEPPVVEHLHATLGGDGVAIMGGYVYRGSAIPTLQGRYVYGDYLGNVWALQSDGEGNQIPELLSDGVAPLTGIGEDADGELYFLSVPIRKLIPGTPSGGSFPQTISATGCRAPGNPTQPAAGVIPYDVNVELWSDGAAKDRWMGLPDGTTIEVLPDGDWSFPVGTVLMKDFSVGGLLIETRLFIRHDDGGWAGYSYEWNDPPTEATLLPGGKTRVVGAQTWEYPSRIQCLACHTVVAGRTLGPTTAQLNREFFYPSTGLTANELTTLETIGMFSAPLPGPPASLPVLPGPAHPTFPLEQRARGYLEANCAHCHAPGGPTQATMDLRYDVDAADMNVCEVAPNFGDLGVPGALLLTPGDPGASVLSLRPHALDGNRMPPLASSIVDPNGTQVLDDWILGLAGCPEVTNDPPLLFITQPSEGAVFPESAPITFGAVASDVEDGDLTTAITWTSDLDGLFGSGGSAVTSGLSVGTHTITAAVTDSGSLPASEMMQVTIAPAAGSLVLTVQSIAGEDGHVVESSENGNVGSIAVSNETTLQVGDHFNDAQFRGIVSFDTSALPDDATIVSATLRLRRSAVMGNNPFDDLGLCAVDVQTGGFGGSTALAASDFQAAATAPASSALSKPVANGDWSAATLDAAGLAAIAVDGRTQMRVAFVLDDDDDGIIDRVSFASSDNADSLSWPELEVTYVPVTPTTTTSTTSTTLPTSTTTSTTVTTSTSIPTTSSTTTSTTETSSTSTSTSTTETSSTSTSTSTTEPSTTSTSTTVPPPTTTSTSVTTTTSAPPTSTSSSTSTTETSSTSTSTSTTVTSTTSTSTTVPPTTSTSTTVTSTTTTSTSVPSTSSTTTSTSITTTTTSVPTTSSTSTTGPPTTSTSTSTTTSTTASSTTTTTSTSSTTTTSVPTTSTTVASTTSTTSTTVVSTTSTSTTAPPPSTTSTTTVPPTTTTSTSVSTTTSLPTTSSTTLPPTTSTSTSLPPTTTSSSVTTSTVPPSTTSTTATSTSSTTETSTTSTSSTTSTTLPLVEDCTNGSDDDGDSQTDCVDQDCAGDVGCPGACGVDATFGVLACRVAALQLRTDYVTDDQAFLDAVSDAMVKAELATSDAEAVCAGGDRKTARRALKSVGKQMSRFAKRTGAKVGRLGVPDATVRNALITDARTIRSLAKTLRKEVTCPVGS